MSSQTEELVKQSQNSNAQVGELAEGSNQESTTKFEKGEDGNKKQETTSYVKEVKANSEQEDSNTQADQVKGMSIQQESSAQFIFNEKSKQEESIAHVDEVKDSSEQELCAQVEKIKLNSGQEMAIVQGEGVKEASELQEQSDRAEETKEDNKRQESTTQVEKVGEEIEQQETTAQAKEVEETGKRLDTIKEDKDEDEQEVSEADKCMYKQMSLNIVSNETDAEVDYVYKVVLVGEKGVGKTSLARRFIELTFSEETDSTLHEGYSQRIIEMEDKIVKVQVCDTPGSINSENIFPNTFRFADIIFLVYDGTDWKSFSKIPLWLSKAREYAEQDAEIVVVGMKVDSSAYSASVCENAKELSRKEGLRFYEASAKSGLGVEDVFICNLQRMAEKVRIYEEVAKKDILHSICSF